MAILTYSGKSDKTLQGTAGGDRFVIDLAVLAAGRTRLQDPGGVDSLRLVDGNEAWTATSFVNSGSKLIWRGSDGGRITIALNGPTPQVEFLEMADGAGTVQQRLQLVTDLLPEVGGNILLVGSRVADQIILPETGGDGSGLSLVYGGAGADTITASGDERTVVYGGRGADLISTPGPAMGEFYGGGGKDVLLGCSGTDSLYGGRGRDTLMGFGGNDRLAGGKGGDLLDGGAGGDTLIAGKGKDRLTGGAGPDVFSFKGNSKQGVNVITDFQDGTDLLRITGGDFDGLSITQTGADTRITLEAGSVIVLQGVMPGQISVVDFDFI